MGGLCGTGQAIGAWTVTDCTSTSGTCNKKGCDSLGTSQSLVSNEQACYSLCIGSNCGNTTSPTCTKVSAISTGLNACFRDDTVITYKSREYRINQLLAGDEPECRVPHVRYMQGLIVEASCGGAGKLLKLTDTHMVFTTRGYKMAQDVNAGDILLDGHENKCVVQRVKRDELLHMFFGLNCLHSKVLADGFRVSTFGNSHTLPSLFMYYAGLVVGIEAASVIGDHIASVYFTHFNFY